MDGIVCVNKPQNMTSFDVIRILRRKYGVKAGHSGTLDPNATGLLLIAVNKGTKALNYIEAEDKVYVGTCTLGLKTDTGDIWGETLQSDTKEIALSKELLDPIIKSFVKKQKQRVPMVSAKKINGKKLYEYHRENIEIETQYTDIEIYDLELLDIKENSFTFRAHVSNGTYIRTLCEDLAEALGTIGTMSALNRTEIGRFNLDNAIDLDNLEDELKPIPVKEAVILPKIQDESLEFKIMNGHRIELDTKEDTVLLDSGKYFAVYGREKGDVFKSIRGLW
ncbi:MAG: tRNA pseudouridine(55) synthase TruB [Erysipelothrix sp.]|nr:tRNA pseudouridine(55) synthase TruB [Erysipelothrix sp.]